MTASLAITVVYPIRIESDKQDFMLPHLARSLRSVNEQETPCEIMAIDYGTGDRWRPMLYSMLSHYGVTNIHRVEAPHWARGRALNVGLRACTTPYFAAMDADCLLDPRYTQTLSALAGPRKFVLSCVRRLHAGVRTYQDALANPARMVHPDEGHGLICAPTKWLTSVRGYDEYYRIWGQEDSDLLERAKLAGLIVQHVPTAQVPQHLPHPGQERWLGEAALQQARRLNAVRFRDMLAQRRVVAPQEIWGHG